MIKISKKYKPTKNEKFMNPKMKEYFKIKLITWKKNLIKESSQTLNNLQNNENTLRPDIGDRATEEINRSIEIRERERDRKLILKINEALERIKQGTYGYCAETDERISIKRLEARPIATLSLEAQEMHERNEKIKLKK